MDKVWEILVPGEDNQGTEHSVEFHRGWDQRVGELTGGLTIMRPAKGQWTSPQGKVFKESMVPVRIACSRELIEKILDFTIEYYDQEAAMAYLIAEEVIIKERPPV